MNEILIGTETKTEEKPVVNVETGKKTTVTRMCRKMTANAAVPTEQNSKANKEPEAPITKKRVAAYCRVSTLAEEQEFSYQSQCEYYKALIGNNPNLELVEVFGDDGCSGLRTEGRKEFLRMIEMAEEGLIDELYVKSISRFSRNVIDCQKYLNILHEHKVRVYFERENIYSNDPQCEMVLKFMAAVAQEESNSQSQNARWSLLQNNRKGTPTRICPYGYTKSIDKNTKIHEWVINEEQAERIRLMFELADKGMPISAIPRKLNEYEKEHGELSKWTFNNVLYRLKNEAYKGDVITAKNCTPNFLTKKAVKNNGIMEQQYLTDHHPAIVDRELFDRVQRKIGNENPWNEGKECIAQ